MIQVKQIRNRFFAVANYLIESDGFDYCWLVDVGQIELIKEAAEGRTISGVFLTHCHHDHMFGINDLRGAYPYCKIFLSEAGVAMLASDKLNLSRYTGPIVTYQGDNLVAFDKVAEFGLFPDVRISAVPTLGHSQDSVTYILGNNLFTGDAYIPGTPVVTKLRGGDREQAQKSTDYIQSLINEGAIVRPGHWGRSKLPF